MRMTEAKLDIVFEEEDWRELKRRVEYDERLLPRSNTQSHQRMNHEMQEVAHYMDGTEQLVDKLQDVRMKDGEFEILISWKGREETHQQAWEPVKNLMENVLRKLNDMLPTLGKRNLKSRIVESYYYDMIKYISWGDVTPKSISAFLTG